MTGQAQFIPALIKPNTYFAFYREWKEKEGFWLRFFVLIAVSGILHALSFFAAFPSFKTISFIAEAKLTGTEEELLRFFLAFIGGLWGLIVPFIMIHAGALWLYFFFRDIGYKALFYCVSLTYVLFLFGLAFELPFQFVTGAEEIAQPVGLGFLGVWLFKDGFFQQLFNLINVFTVWGTFVIYFALRQLSFKAKSYILTVTIGTILVFILLLSLYAALLNGQLV